MKPRATIRRLPEGRRLYLNDGPIDLVIGVDAEPIEIRRALEAAADRFITILDELCAELSLLRSNISMIAWPTSPIARCMFAAVLPYGHRCFITPMAAVAGAVAEAVLTAMTSAAPLRRAYVNNGGDIALHLSRNQSYKIGMVERPETPSLFGFIGISAATRIRGVATSGWRGRSFSLGIADAVTVLAETAAQADAAATVIANAVDLPNHPSITRISAREIAPDSDLRDLPVTRHVGPLSLEEISQALGAGEAVAEQLRAQGLIHSAALCLQSQVRSISDSCACGADVPRLAVLDLELSPLEHAKCLK
jgi:ApbE superfamily uncharacterized protein (UPF0280 family)